MNRPYRYAAAIHPVRNFSIGLSPLNIRRLIHRSQDRGCYLTGQGCSATPQMDSLRNHQD
jgi:hypothetical protein